MNITWQLAQDRRVWAALIKETSNSIGDAGSTLNSQVQKQRAILIAYGLTDDCYVVGIATRVRLLKKSAQLLHHIGDKTPLNELESGEVARTLNRRCYPHTGNDVDHHCQ